MYIVQDTYANFSKELIHLQNKRGRKHKVRENGYQQLISSSFITTLTSFLCDNCLQGKCLSQDHRISTCFLILEENYMQRHSVVSVPGLCTAQSTE